MSRSIHTTRRALETARIHDCTDPERHAEFVAELEEDMGTKRRIKRHVKSERLLAVRPDFPL